MQIFKFKTDLAELPFVEQLVDLISDKYNIGNSYFANISAALHELFKNAVIHGNKFDKSKEITISYEHKSSLLSINVSDEGNGFDYSSINFNNFDSNSDNTKIGLYVVKSVSDKLEFHKNGSSITISFDLSSSNTDLSNQRLDIIESKLFKRVKQKLR